MLIKEIVFTGITATVQRLEEGGLSRREALFSIISAAQQRGNQAIAAEAIKLYELV